MMVLQTSHRCCLGPLLALLALAAAACASAGTTARGLSAALALPHPESAIANTPAADTAVTVYSCSLAVRGFGTDNSSSDNPPKFGVKSASLKCTAEPGNSPPLLVGYNTSIMGEFVTSFQGVNPVINTSCQAKTFVNETALFYLCSPPNTVVQLLQPTISHVWGERPGDYKDYSLLAAGGNGTIMVEGGVITNNHAGTAITLGDAAHLALKSSQVIGNGAKGGGALRLGDYAAASVTDGSILANNTADFGGSVYMWGNTELNVSGNSVLSGNTATAVDSNGEPNGSGGAIYAKNNATVVITANSKVENNTSPIAGGISLEDYANGSVINGSSVSYNNATHDTGGGIGMKNHTQLLLANAAVVGNKASKQGGGIAVQDSNLATVVITNMTLLSNNSADMQGGGMYIGAGSNVVIDGGSQISHNRARNGAGLLLLGENSKGSTSLRISGDGTVISYNTADYAGGAINMYAASLNDNACYVNVTNGVVISDNTGNGDCGGYVANGVCNATFTGVRFERNTDTKMGGTLHLYHNANATFVDCTISNSTAKDGGAAVLLENSSATFINSVIENHTAIHSGGAMQIGENATVRFIDSIVRGCSALAGGAVSVEDNGTVILCNSSFESNRANDSGGATYMLGPGSPRFRMLNNSSCVNNTAAVSGGCAYLGNVQQAQLNGSVDVDNSSTITHNTARYGGGVAFAAMQNAPDVAKLHKVVKRNVARMFGKNVYIDWTDVTLSLKHIVVNGDVLNVSQVASNKIITYVSRTAGPGLNIAVTAYGSRSRLRAAGVKIEALIQLNSSTAGSAAADTSSPGVPYRLQTLGSVTTDNKGVAAFPDLQPQQPPGQYPLIFQYTTLDGDPSTLNFTLHIRECILGEVTGKLTPGEAARTCENCPAGKYSLADAPYNQECQACSTETANCSAGGAVVLPLPGYWQRSPDSALMHRCLNPSACSNDYTRLLELHPYAAARATAAAAAGLSSNARSLLLAENVADVAQQAADMYISMPANHSSSSSSSRDAYIEAQCADGYSGVMCAICKPGYGMTKQFTCSKCMPRSAVAAIYCFCALALLAVIRIMMHLSTTSDSVGMKRWTAAAVACSRVLPTTNRGSVVNPAVTYHDTKAANPAAAAGSSRAANAAAAGTQQMSVLEIAANSSVAARQKLVPALPSSVLKVFVLYMQYMLIIGSMAVDWPSSLSVPFQALAALWSGASSETIAVECIMRGSQHERAFASGSANANASPSAVTADVPVGALRVLLYICVPVVMYVVLIVCECIWNASKPWVIPACHSCIIKYTGVDVGHFIPSISHWQSPQIQHHNASSSVATCTSPNATDPAEPNSNADVAYRSLDQASSSSSSRQNAAYLTAAVPRGSSGGSSNYGSSAPHQGAVDPRRGVSSPSRGPKSKVLPSAAWCGVLAMVTVFFFLTTIARAALSLFMCYTLQADTQAISEGKQGFEALSLWLLSMDKECMGPDHTKWALGLGVPLVVLIYGVLPVAVAVLLFRFRRQLTNTWVQQHFGFLYVHYRPEYYFWEVVVILQTLLLAVAASVANKLGVYNQALMLNVMLAVIFAMLLLFKPLASREVQLLTYASVGIQLFTTYAALSFIDASPTNTLHNASQGLVIQPSASGFAIYKSVMGFIVLLANLAFVIGSIFVLLMALPTEFWQTWRSRVLLKWRFVTNTCRRGLRAVRHVPEPPAAVAEPSIFAARTPSGHPVLVRLDAHKGIELVAPASKANATVADKV